MADGVVSELTRLFVLHNAGALSAAQFAGAKAAVLHHESRRAAPPAARRGGGAARKGAGGLQLYVQCEGRVMGVELPAAADVAALRVAAAAALLRGADGGRLILRFQGETLSDGAAVLADLGIGSEATVEAVEPGLRFCASSPSCPLLDGGMEARVGYTEGDESRGSRGAGHAVVAGEMPPHSGVYEVRFRHVDGSPNHAGAFGVTASAAEPLPNKMPGLDLPGSWAYVPCHPDRCADPGGRVGPRGWIGSGGIPTVGRGDMVQLRLDTGAHKLTYGVNGRWFEGSQIEVPAEPLWFVFGDSSGDWCGARLVPTDDDAGGAGAG